MQKRTLGPDGPAVSALGIGAMSFTNFYGTATEADAHAILDAALDAGVDHIDTANIYGQGKSETVIGTWLKRYGKTNPFTIATKGAIVRDGNKRFDNSPKHLAAELDASLRRLGQEQVALYYVHRRDPDFEIEEVTDTLAGFQKAGKIGAFGFSEIAPTSLYRAAKVHPVAAVQSEYSLQTRGPDLGLVQACEALGTALVAFSPVGRGLLTDTPPTPERVSDSAFLKTNPRFIDGNLERNLAASQPLRALAASHGLPAAALAIGWVLARSSSVMAIPGTRSVAHFKELVAGAAQPLPDAVLTQIDALFPPGWAHGARYAVTQRTGPEDYC